MEIQAKVGQLAEQAADAVVLYLFEQQQLSDLKNATGQINEKLNGEIAALLEAGDFVGKANEVAVLYTRDALAAKRVILLGLGASDKFNPEVLRRALATAVQKARSLNLRQLATVVVGTGQAGLSIETSAQAMTEGAMLGAYHYQGQKSKPVTESLPVGLDILPYAEAELLAVQAGIQTGLAFAQGTMLTRDLVNLPPNICTPAYLADQAVAMGERLGLTVRVLEKLQMEALKMGALLAVAQGSETPPRFIILEHHADLAATKPTLILVGKGVTFDTGGYSMKSVDGMVGMKADMGGAAAVLGAMQIVASLDLPVHVVGLVPSADNMISGKAYRPQEVIKASNGKTIEIISTDAEGRLLLADALVYAKRYEPAAVVDIATLTGAMSIALGSAAAGFFSTDEKLASTLEAAGAATHERVWRMPLYDEYGKSLESDTADFKNSGGAAGRGGGAGVAAWFLQQFVDYPAWGHIDMAGVMASTGDVAYSPGKGASGYGARLLAEWVRQWAAAE